MNQTEMQTRLTAWTWAAMTLGVEAEPTRMRGLIETTRIVPADRLRGALEAAIQAEVSGFLPSPGAVIDQYRRLASKAESSRSNHSGRELTPSEHRTLMCEINPEGWEPAHWGAFNERLASDPLFAKRVDEARDNRAAWVEAEMRREVGARRVSHGFRISLRRRLNIEAFQFYPRPDPLADGWVRARDFSAIAGLMKKIQA